MGRSCGCSLVCNQFIYLSRCVVLIRTRFLFNPFTIATCLGRSTAVFTSTGILYALSAAVQGHSLSSMFALGLASYLSIYPALLFIPLVLLCYDRQAQRSQGSPSVALFVVKYFVVFLLSVAGLLGISLLIIGDFPTLISATYGFQLLVPDLTPNIGLWWYFFIEIFDSFRDFFLGVFWLHLAAYAGSLTVRLRRQPLFVVTSLLGIFAVFKPYPSISDASLYFALLPLYRHIFPCEHPPLPYPSVVVPVANPPSDAIYLLLNFGYSLCLVAGPCFLPSLDLRRLWECQLFLCDYARVEFRSLTRHCGYGLRCPPRRMGTREPG